MMNVNEEMMFGVLLVLMFGPGHGTPCCCSLDKFFSAVFCVVAPTLALVGVAGFSWCECWSSGSACGVVVGFIEALRCDGGRECVGKSMGCWGDCQPVRKSGWQPYRLGILLVNVASLVDASHITRS